MSIQPTTQESSFRYRQLYIYTCFAFCIICANWLAMIFIFGHNYESWNGTSPVSKTRMFVYACLAAFFNLSAWVPMLILSRGYLDHQRPPARRQQ
ncbi:hypothetical protein MRB53_037534 [Persea americana]|nr:hypothetical protein MRB53_037534 [Persea americana]